MFTHGPGNETNHWSASEPVTAPHDDPPAAAGRMHGATGPAQSFDYASIYVDTPVQLKSSASAPAEQVRAAADHGTRGAATALPHAEAIQRAFGPAHDVSGIQAHVGGQAGEACAEIGAQAFASGTSVAFADAPDLHTAAHEAAHVVQQAQGVNLYGGVGEAGDAYERQADAIADRVVAGESASDLLGQAAASLTGGGHAVQRKESTGAPGGNLAKLHPKHEAAENASGTALDDELTLVAKHLYDALPALEKSAVEVADWNTAMEDSKKDIERSKVQMKRAEASYGYKSQEYNHHKRERDRHQDEYYQLESKKMTVIVKPREAMRAPLAAAKRQLDAIRHRTLSAGLDGNAIVGGVNYFRSVLGRFTDLCIRLELGTNYGPLAEAQATLDSVVKQLGVIGLPVGMSDPSKLGDAASLTVATLNHTLDAAQAQAAYARPALDAWTDRSTKEQGQFHDLHDSVDAMVDHLESATALLGQVDAEERKRLAPRISATIKQLEPLYQKGKTRRDGSSPAGSLVMTFERLPHLFGELRSAASAK